VFGRRQCAFQTREISKTRKKILGELRPSRSKFFCHLFYFSPTNLNVNGRPHKKTKRTYVPGLPDGLFSYQNSLCGYICEGLVMENFGIFYDRLEYCTAILYTYVLAISYIVCSFGIFSLFWYVVPSKIWQPWHIHTYICTQAFQSRRNSCVLPF
jgi:hypothetical protein